jgi:putative ATP-dependent endonuclease of OLD family
MRITKVIIENYRSIKYLEIEFKSLFGLIGANSAGKSNILRAINLVLGERYPMPHSLTKKDFYNENYANNIRIEIYFDEVMDFYGCEGVGLSLKTNFNLEDCSFSMDFKPIIRQNGKCVTHPKYRVNNDLREKCSIIFIPATRNFDYHLQNSSEWSFLGKIIKQFNDIFPEANLEGLKSKFEEVKINLETDKFKEFESAFKDSFKEHVLPTENDVDIGFKAFNPKSYYKTIEIIPKEYGSIKDIDQMGEGMKNLIFMALLRAYAKIFPQSTIFLIEEPELFLHPQGRLDLFNIFRNLTDNGSQIIYCTHSQEFIDIECFSSIGRVNKINQGNEHYSELLQINEVDFLKKWKENTGISEVTLDSIRLFLKNISDAETNKAFFAKKIILVEGNSERWMIPIYAKKEGLDLEKSNIEIVSVSGKNNIEKFYLLFKALKYKLYVIFDGDKTKLEGEETNKKLTSMIFETMESWPTTKIGDLGSVFGENMEEELKKEILNFDELKEEAKSTYNLKKGRNKEIIARHVANKTQCPDTIKQIFEKIKNL